MKNAFQFLFIALLAMGCGKAHHEQQHDMDEPEDNDPNQALYHQVEDKHMEVMGKMDNIIKYKIELIEKIAKNPSLDADSKKQIQGIISTLDSSDHAMKEWMRTWMNLPTDTADTQKMREYFETEMEGINKLDDQINDALEKAKAVK